MAKTETKGQDIMDRQKRAEKFLQATLSKMLKTKRRRAEFLFSDKRVLSVEAEIGWGAKTLFYLDGRDISHRTDYDVILELSKMDEASMTVG